MIRGREMAEKEVARLEIPAGVKVRVCGVAFRTARKTALVGGAEYVEKVKRILKAEGVKV